jgi:NDP-sugar pyrophosphorylase family protein
LPAFNGANEPVGSYLYEGYWLDIGRHEDYEKALDGVRGARV